MNRAVRTNLQARRAAVVLAAAAAAVTGWGAVHLLLGVDLALPSGPLPEKCELMQPKQALGTTVGDEAMSTGKYPLYRVTVRVDGPNNALSFVQAMIRG